MIPTTTTKAMLSAIPSGPGAAPMNRSKGVIAWVPASRTPFVVIRRNVGSAAGYLEFGSPRVSRALEELQEGAERPASVADPVLLFIGELGHRDLPAHGHEDRVVAEAARAGWGAAKRSLANAPRRAPPRRRAGRGQRRTGTGRCGRTRARPGCPGSGPGGSAHRSPRPRRSGRSGAPGAPPSASTSMPESSASAGMPRAAATARALRVAFSR